MQTNLSHHAKTLPRAQDAERILRNCVHCGFCNATCPTYQILGDELDGPRGRIYLIKNLLEGGEATVKTQQHLDRCLTCRNCETTCPSGVEYHTLLDIGRQEIELRVQRPLRQRLLRAGLQQLIPRRRVFGALLQLGQTVRHWLPSALKAKVPAPAASPGLRPASRHARKMLMLEGCVQPSLSPNTNAATARVLNHLGISVINADDAGCCGATDYHLNAQDKGLQRARRNIDAWWPAIEDGAEAIVQTASGCGAFVKEYGVLLRDDPQYAAKAQRVSEIALDIAEVLRAEPLQEIKLKPTPSIAFHCPCTLQHAQKLGGVVEDILTRLGVNLTSVPDAHLCCGSAGTYSLTEPELSNTLRRNKIRALETGKPEIITTANIGCQTHLAGATQKPVRHWIELIDQHLQPSRSQT